MHDGDIVWLGHPGRSQMEEVALFLAEREHRIAHLIAPEIKCERWHRILNEIEDSQWFGAQPGDDLNFWVDSHGRACNEPGILWWLIKFVGV